ncbi:phosphopantetheine-binding protein [Mycolicibacterium sp. 120266]|uniref:acyl carrier protein n=1 Tax=Mycolicibacterium sp. 120266 TaxID=3090601 RepID=UPI00299ECB66|nr:phosphopantetheine-binding protein [Mycolicibacterium sp. 120266]MDX1873285.1 phosphopantetheine-binding protein [Mycolicibacterium sp. 120266]
MIQIEIEELILELLAEQAGVSVGDLRDELLALGEEMPLDSLLAVEILVRVQEATGVVLPATEETAEALLSVRGFAAAVRRQLERTQPGQETA